MKNILLVCVLCAIGCTPIFGQSSKTQLSTSVRIKQVSNIHNPDTWDMERMKEDIQGDEPLYPFVRGAFPTPHYDSLMGMNYGGGSVQTSHFLPSVPEYRILLNNRDIMFCSLVVGDGPFYKSESGVDDVFFTLITVVDTLDDNNYAIGNAQILSRNHPDVGGQGSFITRKSKVEFVAFTTPDKGSFAIANMRLFHLEYGDIVLVTPMKDGSFRSMQLKGKKRTGDENFDYIRNTILKEEDVIDFLTNEHVISY